MQINVYQYNNITEITMSSGSIKDIQYYNNVPMKTFCRYMNKLSVKFGSINFKRVVL